MIDEAHHVQASEDGRNALGRVVATLLDLNDPTTRLVLATAYFFRGDHLPIVPDDHIPRFHRHHVPFDDYWKSLNHVKTYGYDFVAFKGTVWHELEALLRRSQEPTIVYCPPERHRMLLGKDKRSFVDRVGELCVGHLGASLWTPGCKPAPKEKVVLDLVDTEHRPEKIAFVGGHGDQVAAVLTVGMFREGADWVEAARVIDLVPSGSDQDRLQRFGRLVRDCPGKKHVSYFSFFPFVVEEDEEQRRAELSKLYAHFHASLVLENAIKPVKVRVGRRKHTADNEKGGKGEPLDLLGRLSEKAQEAVFAESYEGLLRLHDQRSKEGLSVQPAEAKALIVGVLKANGMTEHLDAAAKQVVLVMRRRSNVRLDTEDLVEAGFDKVFCTDIFDGLIAYSAGFGGPDTLAEIRRVIDGVFDRQWMENYERVRNLPSHPSTQSSAYWWCAHNRMLHGQKRLPNEKLQLLELIPWWRWAEGFADRWQSQYDEISRLPDCPKAGTTEYAWVRQQRRLHGEGKLEPFKAKLCEAIPWWSWATTRDTWDATCEALKDMEEPPKRGSKEYEWVRTQRKARSGGKLPPDRIRRLEAIPWWSWGEGDRSRDAGLDTLQTMIEEGLAAGATKGDIQRRWAKAVKVGEGQLHKYLRLLPKDIREKWGRLRDARRGPRISGS